MLVLSPRIYNAKSVLALACPMTSQVEGYPFDVAGSRPRRRKRRNCCRSFEEHRLEGAKRNGSCASRWFKGQTEGLHRRWHDLIEAHIGVMGPGQALRAPPSQQGDS